MSGDSSTASKCACRAIEFLESSIGKKIMVAAAGLLLCGFLVTHLAGNLLMFVGGDAFNTYAEALEHNPLLPLAEGGLVFLFLVHILLSARATLANRAARPVGYESYKGKGARTPGSRTMALTGTLILVFVIAHVATFKYKAGGAKGPDLFTHVLAWFGNPWYAAFYVLAVAGVGLHLSHGVQSALQTFGVNHPRYTPLIRKAGLAFAALIFLGFASMPVYFGFAHKALACCAAPAVQEASK
ncbi:MAG: succinate dehydrogenase cytochrome b subunit [Elusimicrobiota bacterium]|nr:MAG: succinate dehydrogenase cytochrome b subunit [Elusimicrobiota bacterium]